MPPKRAAIAEDSDDEFDAFISGLKNVESSKSKSGKQNAAGPAKKRKAATSQAGKGDASKKPRSSAAGTAIPPRPELLPDNVSPEDLLHQLFKLEEIDELQTKSMFDREMAITERFEEVQNQRKLAIAQYNLDLAAGRFAPQQQQQQASGEEEVDEDEDIDVGDFDFQFDSQEEEEEEEDDGEDEYEGPRRRSASRTRAAAAAKAKSSKKAGADTAARSTRRTKASKDYDYYDEEDEEDDLDLYQYDEEDEIRGSSLEDYLKRSLGEPEKPEDLKRVAGDASKGQLAFSPSVFHLRELTLTRSELVGLCISDEHFTTEFLRNFLVRFVIASKPGDNGQRELIYGYGEINGLHPGKRAAYVIPGEVKGASPIETTKHLLVQVGVHQKSCRLLDISNQPPTDDEIQAYMAATAAAGIGFLPSSVYSKKLDDRQSIGKLIVQVRNRVLAVAEQQKMEQADEEERMLSTGSALNRIGLLRKLIEAGRAEGNTTNLEKYQRLFEQANKEFDEQGKLVKTGLRASRPGGASVAGGASGGAATQLSSGTGADLLSRIAERSVLGKYENEKAAASADIYDRRRLQIGFSVPVKPPAAAAAADASVKGKDEGLDESALQRKRREERLKRMHDADLYELMRRMHRSSNAQFDLSMLPAVEPLFPAPVAFSESAVDH